MRDAEHQMCRGQILAKADELTMGDRERDYGCPVENHRRIARIASGLSGKEITALDVIDVMLAAKRARMDISPLCEDHYIDMVAYTGIRAEIAQCEYYDCSPHELSQMMGEERTQTKYEQMTAPDVHSETLDHLLARLDETDRAQALKKAHEELAEEELDRRLAARQRAALLNLPASWRRYEVGDEPANTASPTPKGIAF